MYGLSAKQLAFVERWPLVEAILFFQGETMTKVSIGEDAKLWLLPLSFRLQEFADCLVRALSRFLDLLYISLILQSLSTWRHVPCWCPTLSHIGVSKHWNGGHVGFTKKFCWSWTIELYCYLLRYARRRKLSLSADFNLPLLYIFN